MSFSITLLCCSYSEANSNDIEDERHFACECNEYSHLSEIMFSMFDNLEKESKLVYLTNYHWKELSIFILKVCTQKRFCNITVVLVVV